MITVQQYNDKLDVGISLNDDTEVNTLQLEDLFTSFIKAIGFYGMHVEIYADVELH